MAARLARNSVEGAQLGNRGPDKRTLETGEVGVSSCMRGWGPSPTEQA